MELFQFDPRFFAQGFFTAELCFAVAIFDALDIDVEDVADAYFSWLATDGEFAQWHAAFGFQAYVDDGEVFFDADDGTFYDAAFRQFARGAIFEKVGEVFTGGEILVFEVFFTYSC